MVKKLLHTRMRVNDLGRTIKFYQDALGLKLSRQHTSPRGAQLAFLQTPNSDEEIELCQLPNSPSVQVQPDLMHLAFEVDDLTAFAAELGASVQLLEASEVGAGASGRNSGAVQHPFDPALAELHAATRRIYDELSAEDRAAFDFPPEPTGLLLLTDDPIAAQGRISELQAAHPELAPRLLDGHALHALEPMVAEGLSAIRVETGFPIPPEAATRAQAGVGRLYPGRTTIE